jgi:hypothetical protein
MESMAQEYDSGLTSINICVLLFPWIIPALPDAYAGAIVPSSITTTSDNILSFFK